MTRTFEVTSSPRTPSPRVTPRVSTPSTYVSAMLRPSIFELGDVVDRRVPAACSLPDALVERPQLVLAVGVVEAQHRLKVLGGLEAFDRAAADALRRRVRRHQIRMLRLERLELLHQRIEGFVGDFRVVLDVVAVFVTTDLVAKFGDACDRIHRARAAPD